MYQLFETIRLADGCLQNIDFHNVRLNWSRLQLFGISARLDLSNEITIPEPLLKGIFKCRVTYSTDIDKIAFEAYLPRKINSLRLIEANELAYSYKFTDRHALNELLAKKGKYDDILIVKDGLITDTSFTNIAFFDGKKWYTPAVPLLQGTKRSYLLQNNLIREAYIKPSDVRGFMYAKLINAMLPFEAGKCIPAGEIDW